jgi:CHASE3 domain sensor protein
MPVTLSQARIGKKVSLPITLCSFFMFLASGISAYTTPKYSDNAAKDEQNKKKKRNATIVAVCSGVLMASGIILFITADFKVDELKKLQKAQQ